MHLESQIVASLLSLVARVPTRGLFHVWGLSWFQGLGAGAREETVLSGTQNGCIFSIDGRPKGKSRVDNGELIRSFYEQLWNRFEKTKIPELLTSDISFHGSLGEQKTGHAGFAEYMDKIRAAFPDFTNHVEEVISDGNRAFARLTYRGTHSGELFGIAPTNRRVEYSGAAVFHFREGRISDVWVLGDLHSLLEQLRAR